MLVTGDRGFVSPVLLVCLVFAVIGFLVRCRWRLAEAKKEEIKRLLVLASEEAARAEFEASVRYTALPISKSNQCEVCYSPTTTRCARCKAVRYCSGKCQIIHWRQGHKENCHPPSITDQPIETDSEHFETHDSNLEIEGRSRVKEVESLFNEPASSNTGCFSDNLHEKDNGKKVEFVEDGNEAASTPESSVMSFSGFSSSSEASDNISVSDSSTQTEPESDAALDTLETTGVNVADQTMPISPKFTSLVDSVDCFSEFSKLNKLQSSNNGGESQHCTGSADFSSKRESLVPDPCAVSSGFWGRTLNSNASTEDSRDDSSQSNSGANNDKLSKSRSSLSFSFNLSGSASGSKAQGSDEENVSDNFLPAASTIDKPTDGEVLAESSRVGSTKVSNFPSFNEGHKHTLNATMHVLKKEENKSRLSSHIHPSSTSRRESVSVSDPVNNILTSSRSERSDYAVNESSSDTSDVWKSKDSECSSSSMARVPSDSGGQSGKADGAYVAISSQTVSSSLDARNGLKASVQKVVNQSRGSKLLRPLYQDNVSETSGAYSKKGLFSYELFVKLYHWKKVELQPVGLINCGNSCYANVVLQCLAFTPPLTSYFLQGLHSKSCIKKEWCFTCEFESLILKAKEGRSPLSPIAIISQLRNIGSQLDNGREEDAHEFLRYSIDVMQLACLIEAGVCTSGSLEEETTLIGLTFGGYLLSKINCTRCEGKSERQERIMDLTVEIGGHIGTLEEALHQFTKTEILDGDNKYQCSRCKSYVRAKKKLKILEAPNILTVVLKRFQSGKFGKLNKPVQFPEILNLAPFMSGTSDKSPIYRLYGVVVHLDVMNAAFSGHYVCYVKNAQNKWFKIDDSTVSPVDLERVLTKGAYMLLYSRCSPRSPRLMRNKIISSDTNTKATPSMINEKSTVHKTKSMGSANLRSQFLNTTNSPSGSLNINSFVTKFHQLQKILEDSSSDSSSLISSNSDEGSCSTDSTHESNSADDLSDYIFGNSGGGCTNYWRTFSDTDASSSSSSCSSSSSPLNLRRSPLANFDRHTSASPETSGSGLADRQSNGSSKAVNLEVGGNVPFLQSDISRQSRNLTGSSSYSETDSDKLGYNRLNNVKSRTD